MSDVGDFRAYNYGSLGIGCTQITALVAEERGRFIDPRSSGSNIFGGLNRAVALHFLH